jgi:hypothetical protein
MIASIALAFLVTLSGTVVTYLYDEHASFAARLCAGACLGLSALGLIGFLIASLIGLTTTAVLLAAIVTAAPSTLLLNENRRNWFKDDLATTLNSVTRFVSHPDFISAGYFIFYSVIAVTFWQVFSHAMIEGPEGISTGLLNNFGDLPFHLSVITGFAYGNNFPPEDPTYAGVRFTYPFLSDFVSAMFVRCGADLRQSMFIENLILAIAFVGLLHRWAFVMLRDRFAAVITPLLVLLNGGFGWVLLFTKEHKDGQGPLGIFSDLPPSFTVIPETTWRWGNAISALLVPQRGFLMGLPLAVIVFTQWWLAGKKEQERVIEEGGKRGAVGKTARERGQKKKQKKTRMSEKELARTPNIHLSSLSIRRMAAAGVAAGMLPLVHAHSFVVVMTMGACIALAMREWRQWTVFFFVASVIALPQLFWSTSHSAVKAGTFFAWDFGWDRGQENPAWFWFKNTGLFIPLIFVALLWKGKHFLVSKSLLLFYLPFTLCFIVPNLIKMAPWIWDNIKVLYYWWLASAPLVALVLARLWRQGPVRRFVAVFLFVCLTLAGALDVAGIALRHVKYGIFDSAGVHFAEIVKEQTPPRSLIVHAPVHNDPVFLTGRRSLMGYPGHIWTHGLEFAEREQEIKRIYAGAPGAEQLIQNYQIEYVVVGPLERVVMPVNDQFFLRYKKVGEVGEYVLYKIAP